MGQYYRPVSLDRKEHLYSHDYDNGLKLMEHSWIGNNFVSVVESLLVKDGSWNKNKIVWAGDYADNEPTLKKTEDDEGHNIFILCDNDPLFIKINPESDESFSARFLVNEDKKEFIDKDKIPEGSDGYKIHPLPLMTCEGNGRGGGDFREQGSSGNFELVGSWSRDRLWVTDDESELEEYTEVIFDLVENR